MALAVTQPTHMMEQNFYSNSSLVISTVNAGWVDSKGEHDVRSECVVCLIAVWSSPGKQ